MHLVNTSAKSDIWTSYSICFFHSGAEFGRQVEAARHVEDKKLCEHWYVLIVALTESGIHEPLSVAIDLGVNTRAAQSAFDAFGVLVRDKNPRLLSPRDFFL
jgi:hypothetical protein